MSVLMEQMLLFWERSGADLDPDTGPRHWILMTWMLTFALFFDFLGIF